MVNVRTGRRYRPNRLAGGYTHAYQREGYEWDVGVHYIGDVHKPGSTLRRIFDVVSEGHLQWAEMAAVYDRIISSNACVNSAMINP